MVSNLNLPLSLNPTPLNPTPLDPTPSPPPAPPPAVYLGLGGNLGDRAALMANARRRIGDVVEVVAASGLYETAPWGGVEQGDFLNAVLEVRPPAGMEPLALLAAMKAIERALGRQSGGVRYGPRPMDIDILLWGDWTVDFWGEDEELVLAIPHRRLAERAFVLAPLAELAPDLRLPGGDTVAEALGRVGRGGEKGGGVSGKSTQPIVGAFPELMAK